MTVEHINEVHVISPKDGSCELLLAAHVPDRKGVQEVEYKIHNNKFDAVLLAQL